MRRLKVHFFRGSHLPVLMKLVPMTYGPIVEIGCGIYSTIYLHWACYLTKRRLVTYENNPEYFELANLARSDFHEVHCVKNYDDIDLSEPWSIAFVDSSPDDERHKLIQRLTHARYLVAHDAERKNQDKYRYHYTYKSFKFRWRYEGAYPHTLVMSNRHDLANFSLLPDGVAPPPEALHAVPERQMRNTYPGSGVRYTICIAAREIFNKIEDTEVRLKLRYISTLAEYITGKLAQYDPLWLRNFYPRRKDFDKVMRKR